MAHSHLEGDRSERAQAPSFARGCECVRVRMRLDQSAAAMASQRGTLRPARREYSNDRNGRTDFFRLLLWCALVRSGPVGPLVLTAQCTVAEGGRE